MRILFIGDVFGRPGRDLVQQAIPLAEARFGVDAVVANVENAAAGAGITRDTGDALLASGVDVMTTGNHVWDKREALTYIGAEPRLLRPLNMAEGAPGRGAFVARVAGGAAIGVLNVMGRVFMPPVDNPFAAVDAALARLEGACTTIVVDIHAEASSEKIAMAWHLDGRVTAVIGTHTHVQTADARVLPGGTAYITDAGMTGPHDSIIGMERGPLLERFVTGLPGRMEPASANPRFQGVVIDADSRTGRALSIERIDWPETEIAGARKADGDA
ncbi:MAG TPA: TIGR00282 family metallophosphoesterase [Vicinamibacterales bacterium]|nr:TIGR00282 family metallophosphoesterase [Vicinamibacterales bacterium]HOG29553.1 TIGR00282 family metallophosphoesterase [Vicinamibacterales bacterium]HOQ59236.1 TIGR00282 family metallophosphoesterase [Vicinamibacterales bacterium]HPK70745.1 TIGR00282 family metallophosphoesterase [Vicinamibacterales bacterium]HPW20537.1 TIGR00282 family metallophosphoesterase [Vicinamibacterales bacterium]